MKKLSKALLSSVLSLCLTACGLASPSDTSDYSDGFPEVSNESENTAVSDDSFPNVDDTEAPGTLTDVDELPIADASEVGKKVTVNLALNGKTEEISFVFRRNAETGKERLVTIENSNDSKNVMLLSVYETSLGSGEALCEALETGTCDAVLAARVYIDWIEGKYTTNSFHGLMNDTGADGFVQNPFEANGQSFSDLFAIQKTRRPPSRFPWYQTGNVPFICMQQTGQTSSRQASRRFGSASTSASTKNTACLRSSRWIDMKTPTAK